MTESIKLEQKVNKAPKNVYKYEGKAIAKAGRELLGKSQEIVSKILKDIRLEFIYSDDGRKVYLEKSI